MEIKAVERAGKWVIKKKIHAATKQCAESLVLYFHHKDLFSVALIEDGWEKYLNDKDSQRYEKSINRVICIVDDHVVEWSIPT